MKSPVLLMARKELLDHLLSLKFHVSMAVLAVLLGLSAFVMYRDYRLRMETFAILKERARPRPRESSVMAVVEPSPLSVFAKGLDEVITRGYSLNAFTGIDAHTRQTQPDSLFALFTAPDLLYIVKVVLSLVALLFAYDVVSGEKEAGTLKLVLSSSISRGQVIAGKMLGGLTAVVLPFLIVVCAIFAVLATLPGIGLGADALARIALMALGALLYLAIFFSLGALASVRARTSAGALMLLLFVWAAAVFAIPSLANLAAEQLRPVPSAQTQQMLKTAEFAKNRFISIQSHGRGPEGSYREFNRNYDRLVEDARARLDAQVALSKSLCRVSPASSLTYLFTGLAGTGLADQLRLGRSLMDYKSRNLPALASLGSRGAPSPAAFEFRRLDLAETLERGAAIDLAALALVAAGLFSVAVVSFLRMDPR